MAQQSEFIESINIDSLKIIKLPALYTALGATINSNIIYLVKLRLILTKGHSSLPLVLLHHCWKKAYKLAWTGADADNSRDRLWRTVKYEYVYLQDIQAWTGLNAWALQNGYINLKA
jgi:hypothetical protein